MRKLTKASLSELAESKEIISFLDQKSYVGGGTGESGDPFSYQEFLSQINSNQWAGGYVQGVSDTNGQISYNGGTISIYIGSDLAKYGGGTQIPGAEGYSGGTNYSGGTMYDGGSHIYMMSLKTTTFRLEKMPMKAQFQITQETVCIE